MKFFAFCGKLNNYWHPAKQNCTSITRHVCHTDLKEQIVYIKVDSCRRLRKVLPGSINTSVNLLESQHFYFIQKKERQRDVCDQDDSVVRGTV